MDMTLTRRRFLEATTALCSTIAVVGVAGLSPAPASAQSKALDARTTATLVAVSRAAYPHAGLDDGFYAASVASLDAKAATDPKLASLLTKGAADLDKAAGGSFIGQSAAGKTKLLKAIQSSAFFQAVRGHTIVGLYDQEAVWAKFGYEGPSAPKGGYLNRGFDDIGWLPRS